MKAIRFLVTLKAFIVNQGNAGKTVSKICRKTAISPATYFNWKKKYRAFMPSGARRRRDLEDQSKKLKQVVADLTLDRGVLQDGIKQNF